MITLDLPPLLFPISEASPAGEDLRYEGTYDRIQHARREDDRNLPQGIWQTDLKMADWNQVEALALDALRSRTKDLQIAVWLLEAWMNIHGFAGVWMGAEVINALCENFWSDLYPKIDPADPEFRLAPIYWMNEKLSLRLKQIPLTSPSEGELRAGCWNDWERATQIESQARRDPAAVSKEAGEIRTMADFRQSVMATPRSFLVGLLADLDASLHSVIKLERQLDEKCGADSPSLVRFRQNIEAIIDLARNMTSQEGEELAEERGRVEIDATMLQRNDEGEIPGLEGEPMPAHGVQVSTSGVRSRAEAYRMLAMAADYLLRVEPHSPTPYLVRRAISWGEMPLADLLQELLEGGQDLPGIYRLLGINYGEEGTEWGG